MKNNEKSKNPQQAVMMGAAVLFTANLLVKIIGAGFKIPLTYFFDKYGMKDMGMGYFGIAYTVYTILFVISTAGFPVAISKMVAEARAQGNNTEARKIFRLALGVLTVIGIIGSAIMYFTAKPFASFLGSPTADICIQAIAPSIFFVAIMSAFRGYFQGRQNMFPTAASEVVESLGKLIFGLILVSMFIDIDIRLAATGAVAGVSIGSAAGALVIFVIYLFNKKKSHEVKKQTRSTKDIMKGLLLLAVPVTLAAAAPHLINLLDTVTVVSRLQLRPGVDSAAATAMLGRYTGFALPMFNLPLVLVVAIATSVVPAISKALLLGKKHTAKSIVESVLRITMLIAIPCAVGLTVLASPILSTIYGTDHATSLLQKLGPAVLLGSFLSITNAILQSYGKAKLTIIGIAIGGTVKLVMNYFLVPAIGIDAAPLATSASYIFTVGLNLFFVYRIAKPDLGIFDFFLKPLAAAVGMGVAAWFSYSLILPWGVSKAAWILPMVDTAADAANWGIKISCAIAICIGMFVYGLLLFVVRAIKTEDVEMLPKGEKLAKLLGKFKLIK